MYKAINCIQQTNIYHRYIKIFVVCLSMTDVGMAVTNLRVVCKIIVCVSAFTEMAILIFFEIVKAAAGHSGLQATRRMPL